MSTCKRKTSIGGQALIEGIMMRGPVLSAMACRLPDGSIDLETWPTQKGNKKQWYCTTPFFRGIFNMVDSLVTGYGCLMKSADKSGADSEEPSKFEKWLAEKCGADLMKVVGVVAIILGMGLAALLFIVIPTALSSLLKGVVGNGILLSLIEGLIKIIILVLYMLLCSRMEEIHRVFEYHGAEHKTIACYESMEPLTVENIRPQCRFHPRCGTSFIFLVVFISILVGSFISWEIPLLRMALKLLLVPVVVGIAYELIKLAGRCDNLFTKIISAPGLWLQRITTFEPDDSMIEVAIAAMTAVIPEDADADRW